MPSALAPCAYRTLDPDPAFDGSDFFFSRRFDLADVVAVDEIPAEDPRPAGRAPRPAPEVVVHLRGGPTTRLQGDEARRFLADYRAFADPMARVT
jgi:hypothetical protein